MGDRAGLATEQSKLAVNIVHFARSLRSAGLSIGTDKVIDAVRAAEVSGLRSSDDFYWALHSIFVSRPEHELIFKQGFHIFWKRPELLSNLLKGGLLLESASTKTPGNRRIADAMALQQFGSDQSQERGPETYGGASAAEVFRKLDFEQMSGSEMEAAKKAIKALVLPLRNWKTRRFARYWWGPRVDLRSTMRGSLRAGGAVMNLRYRKLKERPPPLVVVCDISGSMSRYSRLLLHFAHALANGRERVHSFVFGMRLTNITRYLARRDPDVALEMAREAVSDWSGGTQIGSCLRTFNHRWSRRVLGQGAVIVLISDGLDRDGGVSLSEEMERMHKSCRRVIWLNPLLRYSEFEPRALGVKAMLPHVDEFRPIHNLDCVADLARALGGDETADMPAARVRHIRGAKFDGC